MPSEPQYRIWINTDGVPVKIRTDIVRREKGRIDSPFKSPIDGSVIATQAQLRDHNMRHNVIQADRDIEQEWAQKANDRKKVLDGTADIGGRKIEIAKAISQLEKQNG